MKSFPFERTARRRAVLVIGGVYLLTFVLPAFDNSAAPFNHMSMQPRGVVIGLKAFVLSFFLFIHPGWLANPLFWCSLILFGKGKDRAAVILACLAVGLGGSYLLLISDRSIIYQQRFSVGYYAWLLCMAAVGCCSVVGMARDARRKGRGMRQLALYGGIVTLCIAIFLAADRFAAYSVNVANAPVPIAEFLRSDDPQRRLRAMDRLTVAEPDLDRLVPLVASNLSSSDPRLRQASLGSLRRLGPAARGAFAELDKQLKHPDPAVRRDAAVLIASIATAEDRRRLQFQTVVAEIAAALEVASDGDCIGLIAVLVACGEEAASAEPLIQSRLASVERMLNGNDSIARELTASGLKSLGPAAFPLAIKAMSHIDHQVRWRATEVVAQMPPEMSPAPSVLADLLEDDSALIQREASVALLRKGAEAVPTLIDKLSSTRTHVVELAANILGEIGPDAAAALPALQRVAQAGKPFARPHSDAKTAMERIQGERPRTGVVGY